MIRRERVRRITQKHRRFPYRPITDDDAFQGYKLWFRRIERRRRALDRVHVTHLLFSVPLSLFLRVPRLFFS